MIWSPIKALFWVHRLLISMKNNPQWLYLRQEFSHHKIISDLKLYLQSRKKWRFLVFEASWKSVSRWFFFFKLKDGVMTSQFDCDVTVCAKAWKTSLLRNFWRRRRKPQHVQKRYFIKNAFYSDGEKVPSRAAVQVQAELS